MSRNSNCTSNASSHKYVLVSPVRNEAKYIQLTLDSVVAQSHLPERWVIVSDGSTDATDDIIRHYVGSHPFVKLHRREPEAKRNFSSKVFAIREGVAQLHGVNYDFIGNLDGDVSFSPDYFAEILRRFEADPKLGIAGGLLLDDHDGTWRKQVISMDRSVAGPVQMFRSACYDAIGGYTPLHYGGVDAVAETMARMHGYTVRTFPELEVHHHRRVGTEGKGVLRAFYDMGWREAVIGYLPVFEIVRIGSRMRAAPYIIGGLAHLTGYVSAHLRREPVAVPPDFVRFLRQEQWRRMTGRN